MVKQRKQQEEQIAVHQKPLEERLGLCQWFHFQDYRTVQRTIAMMKDLGLRHLRTGISWADFHRPEGRDWYHWVMSELHDAELELLISIWHTPPSISENNSCSGPPVRLEDFADFVKESTELYGYAFDTVELWNEPNNRLKWDFVHCDIQWHKFGKMIAAAGRQAKACGLTTVLGGMIPVDHHWLLLMGRYGALEDIDVVGIHAFPGMWWDNYAYCWDWEKEWHGWHAKLAYIGQYAEGRPIWVTETGYATWDMERGRAGMHDAQVTRLKNLLASDFERAYWYCALDLPAERDCIEMTEDGGRIDYNEYHLGLERDDGTRKPAFDVIKEAVAATSTSVSPEL